MGYQRGDAVAFVYTRSTFYVSGKVEKNQEIVMATVTSVTREGAIKKIALPGWPEDTRLAPSRLGLNGKNYRLPKTDWDVPAIMEYCRTRPWPHNPKYQGKQFDNIDEARAELAQFKLKKEVSA